MFLISSLVLLFTHTAKARGEVEGEEDFQDEDEKGGEEGEDGEDDEEMMNFFARDGDDVEGSYFFFCLFFSLFCEC